MRAFLTGCARFSTAVTRAKWLIENACLRHFDCSFWRPMTPCWRIWRCVLGTVFAVSPYLACAQSATLGLSSSSAPAGGIAFLALSLTSGTTSGPAGIQWTLTYDPTSVANLIEVAGPSGVAAGKSVVCGGPAGSLTCLLIGMNATSIPDGIAATVSVTLTASATGTVPITLTGLVGASPAGDPFALTKASDGAISVDLPPLQAPVISGIPAGVLDGGSYTASLAPGSIFVVKGTNLSPPGVVQALLYPLQTNFNGVSIAFQPVAGGAAIAAYLLYTYNANGINQLAAVLPSAAAAGTYNVTVTNNGSSSTPVPVQVATRKFEIFTADTSGSGAAAAQNLSATGAYLLNRFTTGQTTATPPVPYAPAHPGDFVIAYGTGLGAIQTADNTAPGAINFLKQVPIQVLVGGQALTPLYAGRSPNYAGLDQINVQLPANVPTGCTVSFQVSVAGQISNPTTIAIAPAGSNACVSSSLSQTILSQLDQGRRLVTGNFLLTQFAGTIAGVAGVNESVLGSFASYSGFQLASATRYNSPAGACQVFRQSANLNQLLFGGLGTGLDAGTVSLSGPNMNSRAFAEDPASQTYSLALGSAISLPAGLYLPAGFPSVNLVPVLAAGNYQLTGSGGNDIGAFTANTTLGTVPTLSNALSPAISRNQNLTITWTGGNAGDVLAVTGTSGTVVGGTAGNPIFDAATFLCTTTVAAGTLTVPASILQQLPATPIAAAAGIGYLEVSSWPQPSAGNGLFTAPLTAGGSLDRGVFLGSLGAFSTAAYQ